MSESKILFTGFSILDKIYCVHIEYTRSDTVMESFVLLIQSRPPAGK